MRRSLSVSHVTRWLDKRAKSINSTANKRAGLFLLAMGFFLISMLLTACDIGGKAVATPTPSTQTLSKISWCEKPAMVFRDEGIFTPTVTPQASATATATGTPTATATTVSTPTATPKTNGTPGTTPTSGATAGPGTPQTVTNWSLVKADLGFTVYLPTNLPTGACLVSAQATIHDPIFGGSFTIGYLLPDHTSLSISEAPLKSQAMLFQCNPTSTATPTATATKSTPISATPSPTAIPTQLCSGAKKTTNIVISGPGTVDNIQKIFTNLQADVDWIPVS